MHEDNFKDPAQALQQPIVTKPANPMGVPGMVAYHVCLGRVRLLFDYYTFSF